jgi:hypothetical protein
MKAYSSATHLFFQSTLFVVQIMPPNQKSRQFYQQVICQVYSEIGIASIRYLSDRYHNKKHKDGSQWDFQAWELKVLQNRHTGMLEKAHLRGIKGLVQKKSRKYKKQLSPTSALYLRIWGKFPVFAAKSRVISRGAFRFGLK